MKRITILTAMTALTLLAAVSCIKETSIQQGIERVQPMISASVVTDTKTLITTSSFSAGAQLGVFVRSTDGSLYDGRQYDNVKYTFSSSWSTDTAIWLTQENGLMYAYHPYSSEVTDITSIPVSIESQTDWLWADPATGFSSIVPEVKLTMRHALSAVRLSLTKGSYAFTGEVTHVKLTIKGAASSAVLDATDGSLSSLTKEDVVFEFTEPFTLSSSQKTFETIVAPCGDPIEVILEMTVDGGDYSSSATATGPFLAGLIQTFNASLASSSLQLYSPQVETWTDSKYTQDETVTIGDINLTLTGDTSNMTIEKKLDSSTGNLIIRATPANGAVKAVTLSSGTASLSQSADANGIRTIILSNAQSDVTIQFNGTEFMEWARIQHVDGTLYTADEWLAAEQAGTVTDADANGVAVRYSQFTVCPHVIYPKYSTSTMEWSSNISVKVPGVYMTNTYDVSDPTSCNLDVNGKANTEALLAAVTAGTIPDAPAAQYCAGVTFAGGQKGYLPAAGEVCAWAHNKTAINACMDAIGGDRVGESTFNGTWTSTQMSGASACYWSYNNNSVNLNTKYYTNYVRAVSAFSYDPSKEFANR